MTRHRKKRSRTRRKFSDKISKADMLPSLTSEEIQKREKYFMILTALILFAFAAYLSILYYGHKVVPNSDFPAFFLTGEQILNFQLPSSYKRTPLTGMLQYAASFFMADPYPDLKAGWMVNAILNPLNVLLLWLIGKELLGKSGKWFALLVIVNPWTIHLLVEPIAETPLLFFILLTSWLIFKRSSWCYLAGMAASMIRYEAAALIGAAFVVDMIFADNKKQRLRSLAFACLAMLPLALWMFGTIKSGTKGTTHYFNVFSTNASKEFKDMGKDRTGILRHVNLIWNVGFSSLFSIPLDSSKEAFKQFIGISKFFAASTFILGLVFTVVKKNWKIMVLLIFFVPYILVHAFYPYPIPRYHSTSFWIAFLICLYGIVEFWKFADKDNRIPGSIVIGLQIITIAGFGIWLFNLLSAMPPVPTHIQYANKVSPQSSSVLWVTLAVVLLLAIIPVVAMRLKGAMYAITLIAVFGVIIVSNQFGVARLMQTGNNDAEFKKLADWYVENANPKDMLATSLASVVRLYVPDKTKIINYRSIKSKNPMDFAVKLSKKGIKYVAWDSRLGLAPRDPYYKLYHLENIKTLVHPKSQGPYKFLKRFENGRRFINLFELEMPPAEKITESK